MDVMCVKIFGVDSNEEGICVLCWNIFFLVTGDNLKRVRRLED
jgi:hypothetical protein